MGWNIENMSYVRELCVLRKKRFTCSSNVRVGDVDAGV